MLHGYHGNQLQLQAMKKLPSLVHSWQLSPKSEEREKERVRGREGGREGEQL